MHALPHCILLALSTSLAFGLPAGTATVTSKVEVLTDEDFDARVSSGGDWLINIYAPWCKHCQQLEPVWKNVAERLEGRVHVAKVLLLDQCHSSENPVKLLLVTLLITAVEKGRRMSGAPFKYVLLKQARERTDQWGEQHAGCEALLGGGLPFHLSS